MADFMDEAAALQETLNATALAYQLANTRAHKPSRETCKDCGFPIAPQRRALGGVERCTECEGFYQREQFQKQQRAE